MSSHTLTPSEAHTADSRSILGANLHIKGEISGGGNLRVDGSVDGLIQLEGRKLTIGASARITADIMASEIVVYGKVKGNLCAHDRIEIDKDGSVIGDLVTSRIMIEDGAHFKGSIEIDHKASGAADHGERVSSQSSRKNEPNLQGGSPTLFLPSNKR